MSASRCPNCAALLRSGDSWCSQCHADLRPPEERAPEPAPAAPAPAGQHRARHAKPGRVRTLVTVAQTVAAERAQNSVQPPAEVVAEEDWVQAVQLAPLRQAGQRDTAGVEDPGPALQADLLGAIDLSAAPTPDPIEAQDEQEQAEYSVDVMLSLLAAERQDGLAAWSGRLDGPGAKLAIVAGGALAITLIGVVGLAILGLLFG